MEQQKLRYEDAKQIAHFIAQHSLTDAAFGQPKKATEEYIKVFNESMEVIVKYNNELIINKR